MTACTDEDVDVPHQSNSKRFMRFGRGLQQQHPATDDVSMQVPARREFMRFGR